MSDINKAILKVAQSNPEFREALQAELGKTAESPGDKRALSKQIDDAFDYGFKHAGNITTGSRQKDQKWTDDFLKMVIEALKKIGKNSAFPAGSVAPKLLMYAKWKGVMYAHEEGAVVRVATDKTAAGPRLKMPVKVEITPHGQFFAKERSLLKAERMPKKTMIEDITDHYQSDQAWVDAGYDLPSYWAGLPKAMIDVIWADMHEGGA